jgi:hypothetical protein
MRYEMAQSVASMIVLWLRSFLVNHRDCLERAFCEANREAAQHGLWAWAVAELARLVINVFTA